MDSFNLFFDRTRLHCQLIIAQADLRRANEFGRALRYRDNMGEKYNTLNKRQRALHETGENIRQLNKKIRTLKAELQSAASSEVAA